MLDNQEDKLQDAAENQSSLSEKTVSETPVNEVSTETNKSIEPQETVEKPKETTEVSQEIDLETAIEDTPEKEQSLNKEVDEATPETEVEQKVDKKVKPSIAEATDSQKDTDEALDNMEKQMVKNSENQQEEIELPALPYNGEMTIEEVVQTLENLINGFPILKIGTHVDELKKLFNIKFGTLLKKAKKEHLESGAEGLDFHFENPIQQNYNDVLLQYKNLRNQRKKEIIKQREENLNQKLLVIEELKDLIENGNPEGIYKAFRGLQEKWRSIGAVPRENYSDLWRTYHFHVERFYDLLHLSNDLRDLDFKHNYEEKMKLVIRVEELAEGDDIKAAFDELQIIHRLWKEDIGPVSRENREEIWQRFSEATQKIHDKRHAFYDSMKEEYEQNFLKKEAILNELSSYNDVKNETHAQWQKSIRTVDELRQRFIKTGKVPRNKDREIWEQFRTINKIFNQEKNNYYKKIKSEQQENLDRKLKLVEQAEVLRDSTDWENATEVMKKIQADWKTIGHVPKKLSDKLWNRFKEACNHYFDNLHKAQDQEEESLMSVYHEKKQYFQNLKELAEKETFSPDLEQLMVFANEWKDLGAVPVQQRYIDVKFNKFLDPYFEKASGNKNQAGMFRYKNMIENYIEQKDNRKLYDELQFVRKKIDQITKEKQQMETNSQFFSNADSSNPMMKNIQKEIEKLTFELESWEHKLKYLRTIEF